MFLTKENLYQKVNNCRTMLQNHNICDIVTIEKICNTLVDIDVRYIPFKTHGLRGMVSLASNEEPLNCILINSNILKNEQNFHGIHEFMHIYLHSNTKCKTFKCYDKVRDNQDFAIEWQANEGAAELIMPYKDFIPFFCNLYDIYQNKPDFWNLIYGQNVEIYDVLSQKYFVSDKVIENRISNLSYEIDQYRQGIPVDKIQLLSYSKRIEYGITPTDYVSKLQSLSLHHFFSLSWDAVIN